MYLPSITTHFNNNNVNNLSFKASFALPSKVAFEDDRRDIFYFSNRYKEIKKYNPNKASIIRLLRLNDEEYSTVMKSIQDFPKRENALLLRKATFDFEKSAYTYNGITDKILGLSFSDAYGFYNMHNASNDAKDMHISRETSNIDGKTVTKFVDKSRFNEDYFINNSYTETLDYSHNCKTADERKISIKDRDYNPILNYEYSRKHFENPKQSEDYYEINVNGRIYRTMADGCGKIIITSGNKGKVLDFSKALETIPETRMEKESFIGALNMLPPQILLELNDTIDFILDDKNDKKLCLYNPAVAANSMIDLTIERLSKQNSLDSDEELKEIFTEEREKFVSWLNNNSDGHLRKDAQSYTKDYLNPEDEILEVIKSVCNLLWMEKYEEGKADDEGKRLLLNFFPETVNFIVSRFELNSARKGC